LDLVRGVKEGKIRFGSAPWVQFDAQRVVVFNRVTVIASDAVTWKIFGRMTRPLGSVWVK